MDCAEAGRSGCHPCSGGLRSFLRALETPLDIPESWVIFGASEHMHYSGPGMTVLEPAEIAAASQALEAITDEQLRQRLDLPTMAAARLYPSIWDEEVEEVFDNYIRELRPFYRAAAAAGDWVVIEING